MTVRHDAPIPPACATCRVSLAEIDALERASRVAARRLERLGAGAVRTAFVRHANELARLRRDFAGQTTPCGHAPSRGAAWLDRLEGAAAVVSDGLDRCAGWVEARLRQVVQRHVQN